MPIVPVATLTVTVPGTIVRATSQQPDPTKGYACHAVLIQALPANVGRVYIGASNMNRVARTRLFAILPTPTANQLPTFSAALTLAPNGIGLEGFYIDADNGDDGVIVTILVA